MKTFSTREEEKLKKDIAKSIIPSIVNNLYKSGVISDAELSDRKIVKEKLLEHIRHKDFSINITLDHRSTILSLADLQDREGYR